MHRRIVYAAQIPLSGDFLQAQKDVLQAIGQVAQDVMTSAGAPGLLVGLACTPTSPVSMTVNLGPGSVYQQGALDGTAFGSLPSDSTIAFQQGISTVTKNLGGFVAPSTQSQSICYLVQVQFQQVDSRPLALPYYNSANPQVPLVGPGGNGTTQFTDRTGALAVQVVAGAAAATGNQVTPPTTSGWLPAYVITVAFGQTSIGAVNIAVHPLAPFLASLTSQHHLGIPGTAPKVDLSKEVQGLLPGSAIATDTSGIATGVNAEKLDGYRAADLLYNGSFGQPLQTGGGLARDNQGALGLVWDDGTRQHAEVPRADHVHSNDATGGMTGAPFAKLGSSVGATSANSTVVHANGADSATTATTATNASHATSADTATNAGYATTAGSANTASNADYATNAGYANSAGTSPWADNAGIADSLANQMDGQGGAGLTETKFKASGFYNSTLNFISINVPSGRNYMGAIAYVSGYDGDPGDSGHRPGLSFGGTKITTDEGGNFDGRVVYFWGEA